MQSGMPSPEGCWHRCCRHPRPGVPPAGSAKVSEPPRAREGRLALGKGAREAAEAAGRWWWRGTGAQGPSATPARGSVLSLAEPGHTRGLGRTHPSSPSPAAPAGFREAGVRAAVAGAARAGQRYAPRPRRASRSPG